MEFYLGSDESNAKCSHYTEESRERHQLRQCDCEVVLANHFSGCLCNIFERRLCSNHCTVCFEEEEEECECEVQLKNHQTGCLCNIFDATICSVHHASRCCRDHSTFYDGELSTMNCRSVLRESDQYWMSEASKELEVSISKMIERNRSENNLYSWGITSLTDEISRACNHKFLREHPGWQGFGSPDSSS